MPDHDDDCAAIYSLAVAHVYLVSGVSNPEARSDADCYWALLLASRLLMPKTMMMTVLPSIV